MTTDNVLLLAVLQSIAERGPDPGYSRPELDGYTRDEIDTAVAQLHRRGYVEAAYIQRPIAESSYYWAPSVITDQGRQWLESLKGEG